MCILVTSTDMSSSRDLLLPWDVLFDRRYTAKNYWPSKIYTQDVIVHWYYWTRLLIKITSFTGCKLCAWTHTVFIIVCLVTNIWNCYSPATTWFLKYRHILQWCHLMEQWFFTDAAISNIYFIYVHLRSSSTTTTTIYNYIGYYSSAVGLDSIALRAMLTVRRQLGNLHRFLMLPSTDAGQTLPLIYIKFRFCTLHRAVFTSCVHLHCTVAMPEHINLNCIVVF